MPDTHSDHMLNRLFLLLLRNPVQCSVQVHDMFVLFSCVPSLYKISPWLQHGLYSKIDMKLYSAYAHVTYVLPFLLVPDMIFSLSISSAEKISRISLNALMNV